MESTKNKDIAKTLHREARSAGVLIIWTDCDREGEGIGYEIQQTCLSKNRNMLVKRARFSCANKTDIWRAVRNLQGKQWLVSLNNCGMKPGGCERWRERLAWRDCDYV